MRSLPVIKLDQAYIAGRSCNTLLRVAIATYHVITYVVYIHSTSAPTKSFISQSLKPDYTRLMTQETEDVQAISLTE